MPGHKLTITASFISGILFMLALNAIGDLEWFEFGSAASNVKVDGVVVSSTASKVTPETITSAPAEADDANSASEEEDKVNNEEPKKHINSPRLDELVQRIKSDASSLPVLIVQGDNRLNWLWNNNNNNNNSNETCPTPARCSFNHKVMTSASLLNTRYAHYHGYAYLFIGLPDECNVGPRGHRQLSPYWCTVPVALVGMELARLAQLKYLIFLDSDVVPGGETVESGLRFHRANEWDVMAQFENPEEFWGGIAPYPRGRINSGVVVFRVNEGGARAAHHWWFNSMDTETKFEEQGSWVWVSSQRGPTNYTVSQLRTLLGNVRIGGRNNPVSVNNSAKGLRFRLQPPVDPPPKPHMLRSGESQNYTDFYYRVLPEACSRLNYKCSRTFYSTLKGWPGDQDRLNAMYQSGDFKMIRSSFLSKSAGVFSCGARRMFLHWCNQPKWKHRYSYGLACEHYNRSWTVGRLEMPDGKVVPDGHVCGLSEAQLEKWDREIGWKMLKQNVTALLFADRSIPADSDVVTSLIASLYAGDFTSNLPTLNQPSNSYFKSGELPHVQYYRDHMDEMNCPVEISAEEAELERRYQPVGGKWPSYYARMQSIEKNGTNLLIQ